jgi:predicted RNA methylase
MPSWKTDLHLLKNIPNIHTRKSLVDLGAGDGRVLRFFAKQYNPDMLHGYESNRFPWLLGKIWNQAHQNITMIKQDFKKADLKKYDLIYCFLLPEQLNTHKERIFKHAKPGTRIITNTFSFDKTPPLHTIAHPHYPLKKVFVYEK